MSLCFFVCMIFFFFPCLFFFFFEVASFLLHLIHDMVCLFVVCCCSFLTIRTVCCCLFVLCVTETREEKRKE